MFAMNEKQNSVQSLYNICRFLKNHLNSKSTLFREREQVNVKSHCLQLLEGFFPCSHPGHVPSCLVQSHGKGCLEKPFRCMLRHLDSKHIVFLLILLEIITVRLIQRNLAEELRALTQLIQLCQIIKPLFSHLKNKDNSTSPFPFKIIIKIK